jgi:hypothetical protein
MACIDAKRHPSPTSPQLTRATPILFFMQDYFSKNKILLFAINSNLTNCGPKRAFERPYEPTDR